MFLIYMKFISRVILFVMFLCFSFNAFGQRQFNLSKVKSSKIKFKLVNNIIVLPVELNGVKLSFVLDTGVSRPILFNLVNMDSVQLKNTEGSSLQGLGNNGLVKAVKSRGNMIKIGDAIAVNKDVSIVFDEGINFTPRLGIPVHGIIGYDVFKDFIVEINYSGEYIRLYKNDIVINKKSSKWSKVPIEVINKKPYLKANVELKEIEHKVKLLIDTGGGDALWLFEHSSEQISVPNENHFDDFLGKGLSGAIYGKRSKVKSFSLASHVLEDVNVAYPDSLSIDVSKILKDRNGSVSGNILKRFNLIFNYAKGYLWLKKNNNFKSPFYYNNSGITIEQRGFRVVKQLNKIKGKDSYGREIDSGSSDGFSLIDRYSYELKPSFKVVELRENSNAYKVGVKINDVIISVNGKNTSNMTLQQVNKYLYNKKGNVLRLQIDRGDSRLGFKFKLDDVFKKKEPSK